MTTNQKMGLIHYAIGRRKQSIAQIFIKLGNGNLIINNKKFDTYLQQNPFYLEKIKRPTQLLDLDGKYDVDIKVKGGGLTGQTDAIVLGLSRALVNVNNENRADLKSAGLLKCDARVKERKKYGLKKARKAPQFSKR
jgi:small subunit ribosomal protein S9